MNINLINSLVLAYIGDAIYELEIRKKLVSNGINKVNDLQKECIKYGSAKGQAQFIKKMLDENFHTEQESDVYKRARNSKVKSHPANTDIVTYKMATGFEALMGYLYLVNNLDRINEIIDYIMEV